jgi:hypothetical protein
MEQQLKWIAGKANAYEGTSWQGEAAAYLGQWGRSTGYWRRSMETAIQAEATEVAAGYSAQAALRGAALGQCGATKTSASQALVIERNLVSLTRAALALAWCGDAAAPPLVEELASRYPRNTVVNEIWLPAIRAAFELKRGRAESAITALAPAARYEAAAEFWPQYLRGQAQLNLGRGAEAQVEFRKIVDHRGQDVLSPLYPLAKFGVARAAMLQQDAAQAQRMYAEFLVDWKDADSNLAALAEAKSAIARPGVNAISAHGSAVH